MTTQSPTILPLYALIYFVGVFFIAVSIGVIFESVAGAMLALGCGCVFAALVAMIKHHGGFD